MKKSEVSVQTVKGKTVYRLPEKERAVAFSGETYYPHSMEGWTPPVPDSDTLLDRDAMVFYEPWWGSWRRFRE